MNAVHESGEKDLQGSSTAVLLSVNKEEDNVSIANLGDSGFVHIRAGEVESRSKDQTHYFNCPYQLSVKLKGSQSISDNPLDAGDDDCIFRSYVTVFLRRIRIVRQTG